MGTTKEEISTWAYAAEQAGCTHLIVVCDTFDHEDYPVCIYPKGKAPHPYDFDDIQKAIKHYNGPNMQKIMEIYKLDEDIEKQLRTLRNWRI